MKYVIGAIIALVPSFVLAQTTGLGSVVDVKVALPGCVAAVGNGVSDDSTAFQCHANYVSAAGGGVVHVPAGTYYFGGTVVIPQSVGLEGVGEGSVIAQKHSFTGTMVKLRKASSLRRIKFTQEQPALAQGWAPYPDYDFQIAVTQDRVIVEDVMLLSPTNGISIRSDNFPASLASVGQIYLKNIRGQPLSTGIVIDGALDIIRINDVHFWPFWSYDQKVADYMHQSAYGIRSYRNDNPFFSQIFTFGYQTGIEFGASPGGSHPPVTGITSRPRIDGFDCDSCLRGVHIHADYTNGVLIDKMQFNAHGPNTYAAIQIEANNVSASISKLDATHSAVNVVRVDGDYNYVLVSDSLFRDWNNSGQTFPAVEVFNGPNSRAQVSNTFYGNGHGAPFSRGNVATNLIGPSPGLF